MALTLKVGIEIEGTCPLSQPRMLEHFMSAGIEVTRHARTNKSTSAKSWLLTTDSSIEDLAEGKTKGDEIVSPPLTTDGFYDKVRPVCAVLQDMGTHVNKTCALHVHVSHEGWDEAPDMPQLEAVFKLYKHLEPELNKMFARSRVHNTNRNGRWSYCQSIKNLSFRDFCDPDLQGNRGETDTKYYTLRKSVHIPTIEFRVHQGTLNARKITNWVYIIQSIIAFATYNPFKYASLVEILPEPLYRYYCKRVEELAGK
jgi:hypothetical protein